MEGENNGKPEIKMDDLGGKNPYFWKYPYEWWIKQCKYMIFLRDFPEKIVHCLGWSYNDP